MSIRIALVGTVAAAALAMTACSSSKSGGSSNSLPPAGGSTSSAAGTSSGGSGQTTTISAANGVLTAQDGHTLYYNTVDKAGAIKCVGECADEWPPVPGPVVAGGGLDQKDLSTTARPDGSLQVTYEGHPLYEFKGDKKAGDKNGDGLKDEGGSWEVASTTDNDSGTSPSMSSSSSGGGGYTY